ncbi:hypothetical protein V7S43_002195 [Phytophthora oleae]|uniref:Secreted protein n=1 Tax=Phytophthora oleae TaxID=2107226 RepID=A0ABD3G1Q4_9STRA
MTLSITFSLWRALLVRLLGPPSRPDYSVHVALFLSFRLGLLGALNRSGFSICFSHNGTFFFGVLGSPYNLLLTFELSDNLGTM